MLMRPRAIAGLLLGLGASAGKAAAAAKAGACGANDEAASLLQAGPRKAARAEEKAECLECAVGHFQKLSGYTGTDAEVTGSVHVTAVLGKTPAHHRQILKYTLSGVDPACSRGPVELGYSNSRDSCGIFITEDTSCDDPQGVPYYNESALMADPDSEPMNPWWRYVNYVADRNADSGVATACSTRTSVKTGLRPEAVPGHAVVVHDRNGIPMACAIIGAPKPATIPEEEKELPEKTSEDAEVLVAKNFMPVDGYNGPEWKVTGAVYVSQAPGHCPEMASQYISYHLTGLDPRCSAGPRRDGVRWGADSCGIAIHDYEGTRVRRLVWNQEERDRAPWLFGPTTYRLSEQGSAAEARVQVVTGMQLDELKGKWLVVKDAAGNRAAYAVLE